eukprot:9520171-Alexandrium_andersonii.AAC.1
MYQDGSEHSRRRRRQQATAQGTGASSNTRGKIARQTKECTPGAGGRPSAAQDDRWGRLAE